MNVWYALGMPCKSVKLKCLLYPAESDPEFGKKAAEQLDKRKKVIVYCGRGGTLKVGNGNARKYNKDDPERMFGIETRSLKACHELLEVIFHTVA